MAEDVRVVLEGVKIIWPNFEGRERKFNKEGSRNFCIRLDDMTAQGLLADGWNVKTYRPNNEDEGDDLSFYYLQINVQFRFQPPTVVIVSEDNRVILDEEDYAMLDWADFSNVDIIFRAYDWSLASGASGRKAELTKMFATINQDPLDQKYKMYG